MILTKEPAQLLLYEELMLLALRDEKGTLEADDTALPCAFR